jgi:hypothetical protein
MMFQDQGDALNAAIAQANLGQIALARDDLAHAEHLATQSEAIIRGEGDAFSLIAVLSIRALIASRRGDERLAGTLLREGLERAAALSDAWSALLLLTALAGVEARSGRFDRATRLFGAADALRERMAVAVSWSIWRDQAEQDITLARDALDDATFQVHWEEGRTLSPDDAIAAGLE